MDSLLQKSAMDVFKSLDTNGDGILDKAEVRESLANFGYADDEMDQIINALDKDGDGTISFQVHSSTEHWRTALTLGFTGISVPFLRRGSGSLLLRAMRREPV